MLKSLLTEHLPLFLIHVLVQTQNGIGPEAQFDGTDSKMLLVLMTKHIFYLNSPREDCCREFPEEFLFVLFCIIIYSHSSKVNWWYDCNLCCRTKRKSLDK